MFVPLGGRCEEEGAHTSGSAGTDQGESEGASAAGRWAQPKAEPRGPHRSALPLHFAAPEPTTAVWGEARAPWGQRAIQGP